MLKVTSTVTEDEAEPSEVSILGRAYRLSSPAVIVCVVGAIAKDGPLVVGEKAVAAGLMVNVILEEADVNTASSNYPVMMISYVPTSFTSLDEAEIDSEPGV